MLVYNHTFKFREPYQVLVDDQLVLDTFNSSFDLAKGLKRTLQAEVKPMITQCCMQALYETNNQGAIESAKQYERRRCNHNPKEPETPSDCLNSVVNINGKNKHRYVVATQDIEIRRQLRRVPGVPLIYMNRAVMVMEPLSDASEKISENVEKEKLYKGLNDPKYAGLIHDEKDDVPQSNGERPTKKRKGPSQPNPLSMKKKKHQKPSTEINDKQITASTEASASNSTSKSEESKKRRRRKHKKSEIDVSDGKPMDHSE